MNIFLDVRRILQNPELPNGCEITSCCELLRFWHYPADKCDLADHYLPRSAYWYGTDPDRFYMGDPHKDSEGDPSTGYYCFAGPVVAVSMQGQYPRHASFGGPSRTGPAVIGGLGIALRSTWDVHAELRDGLLEVVLPAYAAAASAGSLRSSLSYLGHPSISTSPL